MCPNLFEETKMLEINEYKEAAEFGNIIKVMFKDKEVRLIKTYAGAKKSKICSFYPEGWKELKSSQDFVDKKDLLPYPCNF